MKTKVFLCEGIYFAEIENVESENYETVEISKKTFFQMLKDGQFFDISKNTEISDSRFYSENTPALPDLESIMRRLEALEIENKQLKTRKLNFSEVEKAYILIKEKKQEIETFESVLIDLEKIETTTDDAKTQKLVFISHFFSQNRKEISISNYYVITEFVNFLISKVITKIQLIKNEISEIEQKF